MRRWGVEGGGTGQPGQTGGIRKRKDRGVRKERRGEGMRGWVARAKGKEGAEGEKRLRGAKLLAGGVVRRWGI